MPTEESVNQSCSIIYFCASTQDEIKELYHKRSPPEAPQNASGDVNSLGQVYRNVSTLLDEDQGGFDEVFLCSKPEQCLERVDACTHTTASVVLIELTHGSHEVKDSPGTSLTFLRRLAADIQGARFQRHVMPFAVLPPEQSPNDTILDSDMTTNCLQAGAIDILHSPFQHEDVNRIIGHITDTIRPPARLIGAPMAQNLVDSIRDTSRPPKQGSHRPDETLRLERKQAVESAVQQWHFPAQDFNMDELTYAALVMLENILTVPELGHFSLSRRQLVTFLLATRRQYKHEREVHYHNWRHAVDVAQSIYCFLLDVRLCPASETDERRHYQPNAVERILTSLDALILLVSAIGHDVGHPGVNNAFLVACNHPLAQTYNDKSVLENYHCAAYSQLLRRHWPALNNIAGFRAKMISTILATDMQRHFEYMANLGELKAKVQSSEPCVDDWSDKDRENARELIMALLLKAADISNVARPFDISSRWAKILMNEFARQGELEAELQIPTCLFGGPPDTEDILAAAQSQKGFMSLFGHPLFQGISEIMPSLSCSIRELENNRRVWDQKIEEETKRRKEQKATEHSTLNSTTRDEIKAALDPHHKSEPNAVPVQKGQTPSSPTKRGATQNNETSPSRHAAHDLRQELAAGIASHEDMRSSAPFLGSSSDRPYSPQGSSSRRSSKDVALESLEKYNQTAMQPTLSPTIESGRSSTDASVQIHQSYPSSRRGSKDESLTTILVTSGGTPNRRSSPSSPGNNASSPNGKSYKDKRQSATRTSAPSSRSHATSTVTTTTQHSPSTANSSVAPAVDGETTPPETLPSIPSTEDPFLTPENWPNDADGKHRESILDGEVPAASDSQLLGPTKTESSLPVTQTTSNATEDSRVTPRKGEQGIRESRSRSRLRGLKFWKKKKDVQSVESAESATPSP